MSQDDGGTYPDLPCVVKHNQFYCSDRGSVYPEASINKFVDDNKVNHLDQYQSMLNFVFRPINQNCHNPSPKSKVQSPKSKGLGVTLFCCAPPTTTHKNFSQQPDIQLSSNFHSRLT